MEVLLSAMYLENYDYINKLNITSDVTIINQTDYSCKEIINLSNGKNVKYICTTDRGLSRSRNLALENANEEICILCDNDIKYVEGYEEIIQCAFDSNPEYDIIAFFVRREERNIPEFSKKKKLGFLSSMKICSVEIAFRKSSLINHGISFSEEFGAGSIFCMGEENILLYDCLKKKMKILYLPIKIADCFDMKSTWNHGVNEKYLMDKGAMFYRMSCTFYVFLICQFAIRKYSLYKSSFTFCNAIKVMFDGVKNYKHYKKETSNE